MQWIPYGPGGGDARSFAQDPSDHNHVYLGTAVGTVYESRDGGMKWARLAQIENRDDLALDNIAVDRSDPKHLVVGAWVLGQTDGGVYISHDGGRAFTTNAAMKGHSVRALTVAPSDPKILVAGALDGIYRSEDGGETWNRISPVENKEIHEVESIAIDPTDPKTIYAGTWHLPWKTVDGGANWTPMTKGIIDDSDVFSIIVDPTNAQNVYLSACSGIYRSTDKGANFTKVKGIPSTARRTRVLMEDPKQPNVVFAGTTEGIWRTVDSGQTFARNGDPAWIVNDIAVDPSDSNHVLLATDRHGILLSNDGGKSFTQSNDGFSARQVTAMLTDETHPQRLYVGVLNDKTAGGVFVSDDGGQHWKQKSEGLKGADVLSLSQTSNGTVLAGTAHGLYRMEGEVWKPSGMVSPLQPEPVPDRQVKRGKRMITIKARQPRPKPAVETTARVDSMSVSGSSVFATLPDGVIVSQDDGRHWNHIRTAAGMPLRSVAATGDRVLAGGGDKLLFSVDKGVTFRTIPLPSGLAETWATVVDDSGRCWIGGRGGLFYSEDDGATWKIHKNLYLTSVSGLYFDRTGGRVLVTPGNADTKVYAVNTGAMTVTKWDAGWFVKQVRPVGDRLAGATTYEGVVLQPKAANGDTTVAEKQ
ncbi:WD40/YVTN/BNR-like repeat-containing protein [Terriglobus albidus]|uniref:WD40/YVTN/BNR-like repeat-containing protein n=1 Tax=Terriglobus albidus TaxID=1592106 RepID=UPI0021DFF985|nr:hypothetical protein [Terriglobus albidus]